MSLRRAAVIYAWRFSPRRSAVGANEPKRTETNRNESNRNGLSLQPITTPF